MNDDDAPQDGPALRADGTLEGRRPEPERVALKPAEPEAPLELAERTPRAPPPPSAWRFEATSPRRRVWLFLAVVVSAAVAIAVAAAIVRPATTPTVPVIVLPDAVRDALPELAGPPLVIVSEPPGATITGPTGVMGVTPWAGNNPFLIDTEVTVALDGHVTQSVKIVGAKEAHVTVALRRGRK